MTMRAIPGMPGYFASRDGRMLTAEQIQMRRAFVGASEVPMIAGISPFGNASSVWAEKMGLNVDDPTIEQEVGNFLEDGIARLYAAKTGYETAHFGTIVHPRFPWMGATPDLFVAGERRLAQIKLVGSWMAHHWAEGVPGYVEAQVQAEMEVTNADVCDVVALIGGTDFRILPVERDREMGEAIATICRDFIVDHVMTKTPPPVDGSPHATAMLRALFSQKKPDLIPATSEAEQWGRAWLALDEKLEAIKTERSRFEQLLKTFIGEAAGIEGETWRATWKTNKAGARPFLLKPIEMKKARVA